MADENKMGPTSLDPAEVDFPPILRLTNARVTSKEVLEDLAELGERLRTSDTAPEVHYAVPVEELLSVFTPERVRLVESLLEEPIESVGALASRVDRPEDAVADDLRTLADGHVVYLRNTDGGTKPLVPFEKIKFEVDLTPQADSLE